jgi:hypothetical protein
VGASPGEECLDVDLAGEELAERREPDMERDRLRLLELLLDLGEFERDRPLPLPVGDAGVISVSDIVTKR